MTRKQNKILQKMFDKLVAQLGEQNAGMLLAIICDMFDQFVAGVDSREMRTLELTLNDYFSCKYDFENECFVQ